MISRMEFANADTIIDAKFMNKFHFMDMKIPKSKFKLRYLIDIERIKLSRYLFYGFRYT